MNSFAIKIEGSMSNRKMTWSNCFSSERYGVETRAGETRSDYERDWDRLIFSSAFRRLQNKTQVFPLPEEVFVHNRLTHSLEVASVGRSLGQIVGSKLLELDVIKEDSSVAKFYENHLKSVIASACLAHDMGNPAFGHSGEEAISKYFIDNEHSTKLSATKGDEKRSLKQLFSEAEWKDLITFEGNANGLRVLTKHTKGKAKGGYRLTYSTLGAILKYPCESLASDTSGNSGKHRKKYGYFKLDEATFLEIAEKLNMIKEDSEEGVVYKRHPFVYLVEAADDICYNIIDFEDAHRLGILSHEYIVEMFLKLIQLDTKSDYNRVLQVCEELDGDKNEKISYLRAKAINYLTVRSAEVFMENQEQILKGEYNSDLLSDITEAKGVLKEIGKISVEKLYSYPSVIKIELAGFRIMSGLIEDFVEAILTPKEKQLKTHKKVLKIIPDAYKNLDAPTAYEKLMPIIDYISGMTDLFALKLYKNLRGIEMPGM